MKGRNYSEAQIIAALKEHYARAKAADVCRKLGIVEDTFYHWKAKYDRMDISEAKRLLAEVMLDEAELAARSIQDSVSRNGTNPEGRLVNCILIKQQHYHKFLAVNRLIYPLESH